MITKREEALWQIIDDIDTATDMFKPDNSHPFTKYVYRKVSERFKYLLSDGYNLSEVKNRIGERPSPQYLYVKRRHYLTNVIAELGQVQENIKEQQPYDMNLMIFANEIESIYQTFEHSDIDEYFLFTVNLIENLIKSEGLERKVVKECLGILKTIRDKETISFQEYKAVIKRLYAKGIDVIAFQEPISCRVTRRIWVLCQEPRADTENVGCCSRRNEYYGLRNDTGK